MHTNSFETILEVGKTHAISLQHEGHPMSLSIRHTPSSVTSI